MPSDIILAINALIKSGKQEGNPLTLPTFNTIDIYPIFEHAFSENAKATLANKTVNLVHQYDRKCHEGPLKVMLAKLGIKSCASYLVVDPKNMYVRDCDLVNFVALRATQDDLPKAIEQVISTVNHLADKGFTKATLVQLSLLPIAVVDMAEAEFVVISYITLTRKGMEYARLNMPEMFVEEGGMPNRVE